MRLRTLTAAASAAAVALALAVPASAADDDAVLLDESTNAIVDEGDLSGAWGVDRPSLGDQGEGLTVDDHQGVPLMEEQSEAALPDDDATPTLMDTPENREPVPLLRGGADD